MNISVRFFFSENIKFLGIHEQQSYFPLKRSQIPSQMCYIYLINDWFVFHFDLFVLLNSLPQIGIHTFRRTHSHIVFALYGHFTEGKEHFFLLRVSSSVSPWTRMNHLPVCLFSIFRFPMPHDSITFSRHTKKHSAVDVMNELLSIQITITELDWSLLCRLHVGASVHVCRSYHIQLKLTRAWVNNSKYRQSTTHQRLIRCQM